MGYGKQVDVRVVGRWTGGGPGGDAERQQHGRDDAGSGSGAERKKQTDNCSEEDRWGGREEESIG